MATAVGADAIRRERIRQVDFEGWTPEHDLHHDEGELVLASSAFVRAVQLRRAGHSPDAARMLTLGEGHWPWEPATFKPVDDARDLTRAGALLAAELDRLHQLGARLP